MRRRDRKGRGEKRDCPEERRGRRRRGGGECFKIDMEWYKRTTQRYILVHSVRLYTY